MLLFKQSIKKIQTGAVLIEFAIIIPLLLLLVVGICEFSFAFYHFNILNKSVQDGARYFSDPLRARKGGTTLPIDTNTTTNATNINNSKNLVIYGNIAGTGNALMPPNNGSGYSFPDTPNPSIPSTDHIKLTVQYSHNFILGNVLNKLTAGTIPSVYNLSASSVLRVE